MAQVKKMDKLVRNLSAIDKLYKDDVSRRQIKERRTWDSFKKVYLLENIYVLVVMAILKKVEKIKKEKNKNIT